MRLVDANAWCANCNWKTSGKNSMGNAARHHKATGHYTMVELGYVQTFGTVPDHLRPARKETT